MREWWTHGDVTEEMVCHNHSPLARWRVRFKREHSRVECFDEIRDFLARHDDRRSFILNGSTSEACVIFCNYDTAVLFLMKYGR